MEPEKDYLIANAFVGSGWFLTFMTEAVITKKPVHWFAEQWTGFYMITGSIMKELMQLQWVTVGAAQTEPLWNGCMTTSLICVNQMIFKFCLLDHLEKYLEPILHFDISDCVFATKKKKRKNKLKTDDVP